MRAEHIDPPVPDSVRARDLPSSARVELKTLSKENAEFVARHLVMASSLIETDPELAHEHALSASRRGGRIAMVRETLAITAYTIGDYALALRELRTYRRISGRDDEIALMVDCERGLGRPDRALELGRSVDRASLETGQQVQLAIAMSGARLDQGQAELALVELEIPQLDRTRAFSYSPALFGAYAEVLEELGRDEEAGVWRRAAERAENALAAAQHDEFETVDVVTERLESDDVDVEDALGGDTDSEVELETEPEPEPDTEPETETEAQVEVEVAVASSEGLPIESGASAPDEPEAEFGDWSAPADLQAQIQAEYDELIAEIERAADSAAADAEPDAVPDAETVAETVAAEADAGTDEVASEEAAAGTAAPEPVATDAADASAPASEPTAPVSEAAATVEDEHDGAERRERDDDQPSLFDL